tara:strand:- start:8751 stop:9056 length:306 start_codon:yes stop_codon:yes gene_type:complete
MAKIKIEQDSKLNEQDAFERLKEVLQDDPELRKLDSSYSCNFDEAKKSGTAKGSKFDASLEVKANGGGSNVKIEVKLPLMLSPFKGVVETTLRKKMEKALA